MIQLQVVYNSHATFTENVIFSIPVTLMVRSALMHQSYMQAMGAGTREFPPSDINHGTRDFPPPGENANPAANPGGTQATTRDTTTRSSSGSMQCILMVVKALIKMKTKPSVSSSYCYNFFSYIQRVHFTVQSTECLHHCESIYGRVPKILKIVCVSDLRIQMYIHYLLPIWSTQFRALSLPVECHHCIHSNLL